MTGFTRALVAASLCLLGAWIAQAMPPPPAGEPACIDRLGHGSFIGLLVGTFIGLRTGQLRGIVLCPSLGLAAGLIDLQVATWLFEHTDLDPLLVSDLPVWGLIMGLGVGLTHGRVWTAVGAGALLAGVEYASRTCGTALCGGVQEARLWVVSAVTFIPTSVLAVHLTRGATPRCRPGQPTAAVAGG
jgi:hypothetical protein